jgi:hypothetical protein
MTTVPVVLSDGIDFLDIRARFKRGHGDVIISGPISPEIEDELQKAIRFAEQLSDLGEFEFPDLSGYDLHLSFSCRLSQLPIVGTSYGLGLGVEILRLFSGRNFANDFCYSAELNVDGSASPVGMLERKREAAARGGYSRIFLCAEQIDLFCAMIDQSPIETIYDAWGILTYGS